MKKLRKMAALLLAVSLTVGLTSFPALAATKKITAVSLTVSGMFEVGGDIQTQEVDITTRDNRYSVGEYEIKNDGFIWDEKDIPKVEVALYAEEGYTFYLSKNSPITIKGAEYASKSYEDSYRTVKITMTFPPLSEQVGNVAEVSWSSMTTAAWTPASGAGNYEVRLYRDSSNVGATQITEGVTYDFTSSMTKPGTYTFKVRPVNKVKPENKGEWTESGGKYIDQDTAKAIRMGEMDGKWVQDESGWWYCNPDNSYTVNNWQEIKGKWYFFNDKGYMVTGWVSWNEKMYYCDDANGEMLVNTVTKDGLTVGADGAKTEQ